MAIQKRTRKEIEEILGDVKSWKNYGWIHTEENKTTIFAKDGSILAKYELSTKSSCKNCEHPVDHETVG